MRKKLLLLLVFISSNSLAEAPLDLLISKLNYVYAMQANFLQRVQQGARIIQTNQGQLYLQRPKKFRWQEKLPAKQLIVSNGRKIWIYQEELEQVTIKKVSTKASQTPILLLNSDREQLDHDYIIKYKRLKSKEIFKLIPKHKQANTYRWLQLTYDRSQPIELLVEDKLSQVTRLSFSKIVLNQKQQAELFDFKPPKGVDIVQ